MSESAPSRPRPFRFGISAIHTGSSTEWKELARKTEDLGYSTLLGADHLNDQIAPLPSLAVAAAVTTTLRIGTLVLANDFKHPAVLAKELATLDVLSDGRLEWGMGAGWLPFDFETSGLGMDPPGERVERLDEAITVMKHLFGDGPTTFKGQHYRITGLDGTPKPIQRPYPPLLIGAGGRRLLGIAARRATTVGIAPSIATAKIWGANRVMPARAADDQLEVVRRAAGDRFPRLELSMMTTAFAVTDRRDEVVDLVARSQELPPEAVLESPYYLIGDVDEIVDGLLARRERWGVSYWTLPVGNLEQAAPVVARLAGT